MVRGPSGARCRHGARPMLRRSHRESSAPRACEHLDRSIDLFGERRVRRSALADPSTAITFTGPTQVGEPSSPHGPAPRSAAATRRDQPGGHRGASGRVDLGRVGQPFGAREHRRKPNLGLAPSRRPARNVRRRGRRRSSSTRTPVRNGRSRSSAISGPTCPVSASTELRPVSTRSNAPVARERGRERLRGCERVGTRERRVGDVYAGDVDVTVESPRNRFAQRVVGGWWAEREHHNRRTRTLARELARLRDRATAVRIHLELDAVAPRGVRPR